MGSCDICHQTARRTIYLNSAQLCPTCYARVEFDGERVMHMPPPPQWVGKTVYLVTTNNPEHWAAHDTFEAAWDDFARFDAEDNAHFWECQIGQPPVDVTDEARKLVGL